MGHLFNLWRGISHSPSIFPLNEALNKVHTTWLLNPFAGRQLLYNWIIFSASIFVLLAIVLSTYLISEHLSGYSLPEEQKFLVGIILMVPVYALESLFSLVYSKAAFNFEIIRDCYEAFALYCFERYLIACLGGEETTIKYMESKSLISFREPLLEEEYSYGLVEHPFPLNCFVKDWYLGYDFYQSVKIGIVQYMILKMICALLATILDFFDIYGEGKFQWGYGYPYLAIVLNFSQTWALYCLVQFYSVTKDKLQPIKPLPKFLVFKSIVFLTWWQGVAVAFLFSVGAFRRFSSPKSKTQIQDYIICIEMGIAAVVHLYVFPAKPYKRGERCVRNVAVMSDYASLGALPDVEEIKDCERPTRLSVGRIDDTEKQLSFPQSIRDVVVGSSGIIVDDMKFTVSHVVEPVERGIAKINKTFQDMSATVKPHEKTRWPSSDEREFLPLDFKEVGCRGSENRV